MTTTKTPTPNWFKDTHPRRERAIVVGCLIPGCKKKAVILPGGNTADVCVMHWELSGKGK